MTLAEASPAQRSLHSKALMARDVTDVPPDPESEIQHRYSLLLRVPMHCRTDLLHLTRAFQDHTAGCSPDSRVCWHAILQVLKRVLVPVA